MQAYQAWTRARASGDRALETSSNALARSKLGEAIDCVDQVLVNYRDVEGFVLPEYEGYEQILSEIAVHLIDLEKGRP